MHQIATKKSYTKTKMVSSYKNLISPPVLDKDLRRFFKRIFKDYLSSGGILIFSSD